MSLEDFQKTLDAQNGKCANPGCERILIIGGQKPNSAVVDHNHKTNKRRSILCQGCNFGLGHFEDDIQKLKGIIAYLEKHGGD